MLVTSIFPFFQVGSKGISIRIIITPAILSINPLPNDKILDFSKLKALADDTINATQKTKFPLGRVENIVGKGENAGYEHFLLLSSPEHGVLCELL